MAFMQPTSEYGDWLVVDGDCGGQVMPLDLLDGAELRRLLDSDDVDMGEVYSLVSDYTESRKLFSAEIQSGWCARLSVPGYLDCTDWCGPYETEEQALAECCELHDVDADGESLD